MLLRVGQTSEEAEQKIRQRNQRSFGREGPNHREAKHDYQSAQRAVARREGQNHHAIQKPVERVD